MAKTLTRDELREFNGRDGKPAYVAFKRKGYDVTNGPSWDNGDHFRQHEKENTYKWYRERAYKLNDQEYDSRDRALRKVFEWGDHIPIGVVQTMGSALDVAEKRAISGNYYLGKR